MRRKIVILGMTMALLSVNFTSLVYASESLSVSGNEIPLETADDMTKELTKDSSTKMELADEVISLPSLDEQLDTLFNEIAEELDMEINTVKLIYSMYETKAVYANIKPNIEKEEALVLKGIEDKNYYIRAPWIDSQMERDSSKFLPDMLYTDCYSIKNLININLDNNRSDLYNSLKYNVKERIALYEAIIQYIDDKYIDIHSMYCNIVAVKNENENLVTVNDNSLLEIKDDFRNILENNGISNTKTIECIALIFASDDILASANSTTDLQEYQIKPFESNKTTQENMILAASSIVGKCRYVWGGGHDETAQINGINPAWALWDDAYGNEEGSIRPAKSYCPIHGHYNDDKVYSDTVYSVDDYLESRDGIIDTSSIDAEEYEDLLNIIDIERGICAHRLDGLDCSGFVSWVYNQITDDKQYNAMAKDYVNAMGLDKLPIGSKLEPGDVFAWSSHIIMIVAPYSENSKAYLSVESVPDMVSFGVAYYSGAKGSEIDAMTELAAELNCLIGGMDYSYDTVHKNNMSTIGKYKITDDEDSYGASSTNTGSTEVRYGKFSILGRYNKEFEETFIEEYDKDFSKLSAVEMMQYIVDKLPYEYLSGYNKYVNTDTNLISSDNIRMWKTVGSTEE
ncbi:MAG: hypothetical protein J6A59_10625 [Lachnospiraceae bacterium]|nr:hypothetical protein [Lachnospiraceae bacterium]